MDTIGFPNRTVPKFHQTTTPDRGQLQNIRSNDRKFFIQYGPDTVKSGSSQSVTHRVAGYLLDSANIKA